MLDEIGAVIGTVLGEHLPAGTDVRRQAPRESWQDEGSVVGLFLYRVRESSTLTAAGIWAEDRDDTGRVVGRRPPERLYDLCYLITAWATDPDQELELLGRVLRAFANDPVLPPDRLTGSLAHSRGQVTVSVGRDDRPPELWSGLGLPLRTALDLVVTVPAPPVVRTELARPPETLDLGIAGHSGAGRPTDSSGRGGSVSSTAERTSSRRPKSHITEGERDGSARGQAR